MATALKALFISPSPTTYSTPNTPKTPADEGIEFFHAEVHPGEPPIRVYELRLDPDGGPSKELSVRSHISANSILMSDRALVHSTSSSICTIHPARFSPSRNPCFKERRFQNKFPAGWWIFWTRKIHSENVRVPLSCVHLTRLIRYLFALGSPKIFQSLSNSIYQSHTLELSCIGLNMITARAEESLGDRVTSTLILFSRPRRERLSWTKICASCHPIKEALLPTNSLIYLWMASLS